MLGSISIGDFHQILIHFPIALVIITFVVDLVSLIRKRKRDTLLTAGHWFMIAAAILVVPTAVTGWFASDFYEEDDPDVFRHQVMAIFTAIFIIAYAIIRAYALSKHKIFPVYFYVIASLFVAILVGITAELGGIVVRAKGIILHTEREVGTPLPYGHVKEKKTNGNFF